MASVQYLQNKRSIYRYRETHREKVLQINRDSARRRYNWRCISAVFLRILMP
jgi:hypothetical protein